MYAIGYSQDWEWRMVPASHWDRWGPTASKHRRGWKKDVLIRSVLSPLILIISILVQPPLFQMVNVTSFNWLIVSTLPPCLTHTAHKILCSDSFFSWYAPLPWEDHIHGHGFNWARSQNRYAGLASTWVSTEGICDCHSDFSFMEILTISSFKEPSSTSEFTMPPAKPASCIIMIFLLAANELSA